MINDRRTNKGRMKTSLEIFTSLFIERVRKGCLRVACERMLETEHKLHILTPLLWPSCCVFLVLLMLGSTPSGLSEGPLGLVWPSLPQYHGYCIGGFRGPPRSGVAFPTTSRLLPSGSLLATALAPQTQLS